MTGGRCAERQALLVPTSEPSEARSEHSTGPNTTVRSWSSDRDARRGFQHRDVRFFGQDRGSIGGLPCAMDLV